MAQNKTSDGNIDPRLVEIIQIVKGRAGEIPSAKSDSLTRDEIYLNLIDRMQTSAYSRETEAVVQAAEDFERSYKSNASIDLSGLYLLHTTYAQLLRSGANNSELLASLSDYTVQGSWFEKYIALSLTAHIHGTAQERQAALQNAQYALSLIPQKPIPEQKAYVTYARTHIASTIAHFHNLQGNSELALSTSLELRMTLTTSPKSI